MNQIRDLSPGLDESAAEDPRLVDALREYQSALEVGSRPNKKDFLARYSDIAFELAQCLDGLEFLRATAPHLQPTDGGDRIDLAQPEPAPDNGTLGDFRLLREIGRGGMGIVYEAEQISLSRRVALKVLPFAATLDARQLQRFENEARAAAGLHHAHIVPVFAVGCERGVHYYAMQLINGQTLAAVIARLRQTQEAPATERALGSDTSAGAASVTQLPGFDGVAGKPFFRTVAQLGVQAAEALEFAHQMGVVHRDVKPANLLLDGKGDLWVTDFGLARFSSCPGVTSPGDVVGTLRYMSPEQAGGKPVLDPRSDVYSLGATLYELLTLQPAFIGRDHRFLLRQILDEEPLPPRRLNKALPVELETIVLKAMAKQAEDRYPSARELADDLGRFLDDRPVQARRPGLRERLAKWAWRRRGIVVAAVLGLMAAVLVLAVTTWRISRAEAGVRAANEELVKEQHRAEAALAQEAEQRLRVERNYRQARKVLDFLTHLGVEELAGKPELQALRKQLLTELLAYYTEFIDQHGDDASIQAELIETQVQVAEILDEVGKKAESFAAYEKAMRDHDRLPDGPRSRGTFGGFFGMPHGFARAFLLRQSAVHEELKLTPEQVEQVLPLVNFQKKAPTEKNLLAAEKAVACVLAPEQSERLQQIIRQMRGSHSLLDADVSSALGLSEKQKQSLQALLFRSPRPPGPPPRRRGGPGRRSDGDRKRADQVLTQEQRALWQQMLGDSFRGEIRFAPAHPGFSRAGR